MSSIASALKTEIVRLARKELKRELVHLRRQVASHRTALAALRKQVTAAERSAKQAARGVRKSASPAGKPSNLRFSAKGLKTQRAKLGLSAAEFGRLVGVTGTTVFNWESGKARPQRAQLEALRGVRGLGKRTARARLDEMSD